MRHLLAFAAALLIAVIGFMPKAAWAEAATVGGTPYDTVSEAIEKAPDGGTVTLTGNAQDIVVPDGKRLTIDLNGYTVTAVDNHAITNNGNLTIVGPGTVDGGSVSGKGAIYNSPTGIATLNGGTFTGDTWYVIKNLGSMTINAGFSLVQNDAGSSAIDNGYYGNSSSDCGVEYPQSAEVTLTINGGTFSGGMNTVKNDDFGVLEISGGDFSNTNGPTVLNWHRATISGGTFKVNHASTGVLANGYLSDNADAGQLTITGGTFMASDSGVLFTYPLDASEGGSIDVEGGTFSGKLVNPDDDSYPSVPSISGGTFTDDVDAFLVEGVTQDGNGVVVELPDVATVNGVGYQSFEEAVAKAQDGQTVTLLADASTAPVMIGKGVTIDLGGHTLSITGKEKQDDAGITFTDGSSTIKNGTIVDTCKIARTFAVVITGQGTALTMEDATLTVEVPKTGDGYGMRVLSGAELTLNEGATVNSAPVDGNAGYIYGITVYGSDRGAVFNEETATKLTVNEGARVEAYAFAVSGNGDGKKDNTLITINGGTLVSEAGPAIYHPQYGKLVINGGTLDGCSGVEIRAGELIVNGGTINGDTEETIVYRKDQIGGGNSVDGGGIIVAQHSTKLPIKVTVNGGTIEANTAFIQHNVMENDQDSIDLIEMSITGGEFVGALRSDNFKDENGKGFISGGSFSDRAVGDFLAPDAAVAVNDGATPYDIFPSTDEALENGGAHAVVDGQGNTWVFADKDAAEGFAQQVGGKVTTIIHTVTFDDCLASTENTVVEVENGTTVARPAEPVCAGWTFEGWYADASLITPYDFSAPVTGDITLYAKWSKDATSISGEEEPQPPADETLTSTGDMVPLVTAVIAAAGAGALGLAGAMRRRMR